jgi:hypothetical protein
MRILIGTVLLIFGIAGTVSAGVDMQEGNWETTIEMTMEGMPFPMPPMTSKVTQCLTKKDLVPNTSTREQKCEMKNQKISGNKVNWKMICVDKEGRSEGEGEMTYSGSSYKGVIKTRTTTKGSNETIQSTMKMQGRRIGNCQK